VCVCVCFFFTIRVKFGTCKDKKLCIGDSTRCLFSDISIRFCG
jgi:hypothetical protein